MCLTLTPWFLRFANVDLSLLLLNVLNYFRTLFFVPLVRNGQGRHRFTTVGSVDISVEVAEIGRMVGINGQYSQELFKPRTIIS
jgi:hypothetical protein